MLNKRFLIYMQIKTKYQIIQKKLHYVLLQVIVLCFRALNQKLVKLLKLRSDKMPTKPNCLPLESVEQVELFENIEEEQNDEIVSFA